MPIIAEQSQATEVELATPSHIDFLVTSILQLQQHETEQVPELHPKVQENLTQWLNGLMENPNALILISQSSGTPSGCLIGEIALSGEGIVMNPLIGKVSILWVEPNFRTSGIATQLLDSFENVLIENGINAIECQHTVTNDSANQFWQAKGFAKLSITRRKSLV
ncbi:MAG: GNAT family N-acetyltransferase [Gammaproteobacteria bacterium]|nr:GNAT family N-acetyltransferase [Gammaproteobacteria bacterium]